MTSGKSSPPPTQREAWLLGLRPTSRDQGGSPSYALSLALRRRCVWRGTSKAKSSPARQAQAQNLRRKNITKHRATKLNHHRRREEQRRVVGTHLRVPRSRAASAAVRWWRSSSGNSHHRG